MWTMLLISNSDIVAFMGGEGYTTEELDQNPEKITIMLQVSDWFWLKFAPH